MAIVIAAYVLPLELSLSMGEWMSNVAPLLYTCFDCGSEATLEQLDYDQNCSDCAEQRELDKQWLIWLPCITGQIWLT